MRRLNTMGYINPTTITGIIVSPSAFLGGSDMSLNRAIHKYNVCIFLIMKSLQPGVAKDDITKFLFQMEWVGPGKYDYVHIEKGIGEIQNCLKEEHPDVYRKNSNLTMIHRHLNDLREQGLIEEIKVPGDYPHYRITKEGEKYVLQQVYADVALIYRELEEIQAIDDYYRTLQSDNMGELILQKTRELRGRDRSRTLDDSASWQSHDGPI